MPQFYLVSQIATTTDYSNITDLEVMMVGGQARLFASTLYDGTLTSWNLGGAGLTLVDTVTYLGGLRAGGTASIMQLEIDGHTSIMTGGGRSRGALQTHQLTETGQFGENKVFPWTAFPLASLSQGETVTLGNGNQAVFGSLASGADMGCLVFDSAGALLSFQELYDRENTFADHVTAISSAQIGTAQYLLTASGTENGITVWAVSNTGDIAPKSSIGTEDGLWVAAPTAMEVATIGAKTYVVLASAGSSSLTVMSLDALGNLQVTDHVIDSQNSRFAGVSALTVIEHQGQIYVIAGGADDGISLFLLRPDGTLLARGHLADTTQMGLENVSAISAVSAGNGIDIFVASSQVAGITQLHFVTGPMGLTLNASSAGGTLSGGAGMDVITGRAGADVLFGGAGDDILTDGAGSDRLTGGAGADTFIFAYDRTVDTITDFEIGVDEIDLSAWPGLRSTAQLTFTPRANGVQISYGTDVLIVLSADGRPIDPTRFSPSDLIGDAHVPQNIVPGFAGPATAVPTLPTRPDYTPFVYTPAPTDPTPESGVATISINQTDNNTPDATTSVVTPPTAGSAIIGTNGADVLTTTAASPHAYGLDGADILYGSGAINRLYGGDGDDKIYGRGGDDYIVGSGGDDRLYGNKGTDKIIGGAGDDCVVGGGGDDTLKGKAGNDTLKGGGGADDLKGNNGTDTLKGGGGNDQLFGGAKADKLYGASGNDRLVGGGGNDLLNGSKGNDVLTGGKGDDRFIFNDGQDRITDFNIRDDSLYLDDLNWSGDLSAAEVVDRYAEIHNGSVVFDFGGNDELTLTDVTDLNALIDTISIF